MTRLTDLHTAAIHTAHTAWGHLGAPINELWTGLADMPLPVALAAVTAGGLLVEAIERRDRKDRT